MSLSVETTQKIKVGTSGNNSFSTVVSDRDEIELQRENVRSITVPAAEAGSLTLRTSDTAGELTMTNVDHGIETNALLDIYWDGGSRRGATIGIIESGSQIIPFSGGAGDVLPSTSTAVTAMTPLEREFAHNGFRSAMIFFSSPNKSILSFLNSLDGEEWARVFEAGAFYSWSTKSGTENPIAELTFAKFLLSQGGTRPMNLDFYFGLDDVITSANSPPELTIPGTQTTDEDDPVEINGISIADEEEDDQEVTLTGTNGTVTLAQIDGLAFSVGDGTDDATMTFTGSLADINAALDPLTFSPTLNFNGTGTIAITSEDEGGIAEDELSITVGAVNDVPVLTVPGSQSGTEDTPKSVTGISIADVESNNVRVTLNNASNNMTFTLNGTTGLTFTTGDGTLDNPMVFEGTLANINTAINPLLFTPNQDITGGVTCSITVLDLGAGGGSDSDSVTCNFSAVNDPPVLTVPGAQSGTEDTPKAISGFNIVDVEQSTVRVTLSQTNGTFNLSTTTGLSTISGGNDSAAWTFQSTKTNCINALNSMTLTPTNNFVGDAVLSVTVDDLNGGTDSDSVTTSFSAVNDAPVLSDVSGTLNFTEGDGPTVIDSSITLTDVDDTNIESGYVEIGTGYVTGEDVLDCTTVGGISKNWNAGTGQLELTGTATKAQYEQTMESATFDTDDPATVGERTINFRVNDGTANSNVVSRTVDVAAASGTPPTITSNGGGATATIYCENDVTLVTTVTATGDATIVYSLGTLGGDEANFAIDPDTGELTSDTVTNGDNVVEVLATNGAGEDSQIITVKVANTAGPSGGFEAPSGGCDFTLETFDGTPSDGAIQADGSDPQNFELDVTGVTGGAALMASFVSHTSNNKAGDIVVFDVDGVSHHAYVHSVIDNGSGHWTLNTWNDPDTDPFVFPLGATVNVSRREGWPVWEWLESGATGAGKAESAFAGTFPTAASMSFNTEDYNGVDREAFLASWEDATVRLVDTVGGDIQVLIDNLVLQDTGDPAERYDMEETFVSGAMTPADNNLVRAKIVV